MNNELREAAERFRNRDSSSTYPEGLEGDELLIFDAQMLAESYLAEHLPDDNETADEEWLNELAKTSEAFVYSIIDGVAHFGTSNARNGYCSLSERDKPITRGQVRLLLRVLQ